VILEVFSRQKREEEKQKTKVKNRQIYIFSVLYVAKDIEGRLKF
jgi:hypothetical protein